MTYFMTPKVNLTFDFDLDLGYDPKRSRVIRDLNDLLYDPKGHGDLCGGLDLVYDPKCHVVIIEVIVTYFMTPQVTVTFVDSLT